MSFKINKKHSEKTPVMTMEEFEEQNEKMLIQFTTIFLTFFITIIICILFMFNPSFVINMILFLSIFISIKNIVSNYINNGLENIPSYEIKATQITFEDDLEHFEEPKPEFPNDSKEIIKLNKTIESLENRLSETQKRLIWLEKIQFSHKIKNIENNTLPDLIEDINNSEYEQNEFDNENYDDDEFYPEEQDSSDDSEQNNQSESEDFEKIN